LRTDELLHIVVKDYKYGLKKHFNDCSLFVEKYQWLIVNLKDMFVTFKY
jgi:hypothetical protein